MLKNFYGIIYLTTNLLNGKIYVGQTTRKNPNYLGSGTNIVVAINEYGPKHFKREILCECDSYEELNKKEKFWIDTLMALVKYGNYNLTSGGVSGFEVSDETKHKMSDKKKGRKHTEETKKKMKKSHKRENLSLETRQKISESKKRENLSLETRKKNSENNSKPVNQYDLEGNFIREYKSIKVAGEMNNIFPQNISYCCKGNCKFRGGYIWKYSNLIN